MSTCQATFRVNQDAIWLTWRQNSEGDYSSISTSTLFASIFGMKIQLFDVFKFRVFRSFNKSSIFKLLTFTRANSLIWFKLFFRATWKFEIPKTKDAFICFGEFHVPRKVDTTADTVECDPATEDVLLVKDGATELIKCCGTQCHAKTFKIPQNAADKTFEVFFPSTLITITLHTNYFTFCERVLTANTEGQSCTDPNTLFEKPNFCPKIKFWQNPNISTSFSPQKTTTFSGNQSWIFGQKMKISNSVQKSCKNWFLLPFILWF